jgi:putative redox protein
VAVTGAHAPIVITHHGGVKFAAKIRKHRVLVDQPTGCGGEDSAPMPIELLGAALGTCIAYYVREYLHARDLPYEGMRVEVEQRGAKDPARIAQFVARIILASELPAHHMELLERVARSCPAHGTFVHGAEVDVRLEVPSAVGA